VNKVGDWKSILKADPTDWLLEKDNPSTRYYTLVDIFDRPNKDPEVITAREQIMKEGPVPRILAKQKKEGYWGKPEDFYIRSKYKGTVWQIIILAELGADGSDKRIRNACKFVLENVQNRESGGFSYKSLGQGGDYRKILPCLTGNLVWSLIRFGYLEDPRVQHGIEWITKYQRFDDSETKAPNSWPYDRYEKCYGKHSCHMGVVKALKALAEIPEEKRSEEVIRTIKQGSEYILKHHIYKRSHDLSKISKPSWLQFGFPLMWNTDVLEVLRILSNLGYKDERMQEAVDLVISKQDGQGRWKLESTYNGRFLVNIEQKRRPSKWVTLNAIRALKRFYNNL